MVRKLGHDVVAVLTIRDLAGKCSAGVLTVRDLAGKCLGRRTRRAAAELFVADVMLSRSPTCGYDLSTRRLRGNHGRDEWGTERSPVHAFSKRCPAVPMIRASRDPHAGQAVYILSRRVGGFVVLDAKGRAAIPMIVGVAAPEAGRGAYNLLLVVEDGSWRVDRVRRITVHDSG